MSCILLVCVSLLVAAGSADSKGANAVPFSVDEIVQKVSRSTVLSSDNVNSLGDWRQAVSSSLLEEFMIDTTTNYVSHYRPQLMPSVAFDGVNYLVVWEDARDGRLGDIYGARVNPLGIVLDTLGIAISTGPEGQYSPSVAFGGANYLVVWQDFRSGFFGHIYGARMDPSGTLLDPSGIPVCTMATTQEHPTIAHGTSNYLVVWDEYHFGTEYDLYCARIDTSGTLLDPSGIVVSNGADDQRYPSAAFDGTNYLAAWSDWRNGSSGCDIYGSLVDTSGTVLNPSGVPICTTAQSQAYPSMAFDGTNYLVVWQDRRDITIDIYGARVDVFGGVLDPTGIAICSDSGSQLYPSVAFNGTDHFVVWGDGRSGLYGRDIYGSRVDTSGTVLDTFGIEICSAYGTQTNPTLACDGTNCLVVWEDRRSLVNENIFGARVDQSGTVLDTSGLAICIAPHFGWYGAVAFDGSNYLVVWEDFRSGFDLDIYGARVDESGVVLDPSGILICTAPDRQSCPSVAFDGTNYLVVWADERAGVMSGDIYGARVSLSGTVLDPSCIAISTAQMGQSRPSVTFAGGMYLVIWEDYRSGLEPPDIYGGRVDTSGVVLDPLGIPISVGLYHEWSSSVGSSGTRYLAVWSDARSGFEEHIYGARVTTSGAVLDPTGLAISTASGHKGWTSVAFDGTNYLVAWTDQRDSTNNEDIYCARLDTSGTVLDPEGIPVSKTYEDEWIPSVTFDGTNYLVVWQDNRSGAGWNIYGARIDTTGTVLDTTGLELMNQPSDRERPAVASGPDGEVLLVYHGVAPEPYDTRRVFGALYTGVGIEEKASGLDKERSSVELFQNKPNPFHVRTIIKYQIPRTKDASLKVYDSSGRLVRVLVDKEKSAGRHTVTWNGGDTSDHELPSGIYFYRLQTGESTLTRKMIFLR